MKRRLVVGFALTILAFDTLELRRRRRYERDGIVVAIRRQIICLYIRTVTSVQCKD